MNSFQIALKLSNKTYSLIVAQIVATDEIETYEVKAKNHTFLLECNRAIMAAKKLEHLAWQWKLICGSEESPYVLKEIIIQLEKSLRQLFWKECHRIN